MDTVPIINLQQANSGNNQLDLIDRACRDHGFFILENHGIQESINTMWKASENFFKLSDMQKSEIVRTDNKPLGYYDRELTKRKRDLKEVFDFMDPESSKNDFNQWPDDDFFKNEMSLFFRDASVVAEQTLRLIFKALTSNVTTFPSGTSETSTVRLNFYPIEDPLLKENNIDVSNTGDMALHHHTDPGVITLLMQDMTGGLQALSKKYGWIDIPPSEDTIVVNLGDAMQVWTNDEYVAAIHRVLKRTDDPRYSTPYFYNPPRDEIIKPLRGVSNKPDLYKPFTWKQYIQGRVSDNYKDLGEDDIQIERFRIS